ncbi:MAG: flp pilus-assembly TadE/G-like family protein [Actinomycetales bacterium]|nr:flp pilus-assembly TadE/G-like family protein [Actinomycetales bacterium]
MRAFWAGIVTDTGSGAMLTLGIGASFLILTFLLIPLLGGFVMHQRAQGVADIAALAAADTASGRQPGNPCVLAETLVSRAAFFLRECRIDGLISRVTVTTTFGPFEIVARARAGPSSAT